MPKSSPCLDVLRFLGRLHEDAIHARRQEASEKRQGTKSREVWHPTVQERLWGIRRVDCGVDRGREALGGRYWGDGSAKPGESSWKEAKSTAAVGVGRHDRVSGAVAGG